MNDHIDQWLEAYHDGLLVAHQVDKVEYHLATCMRCQQSLNALQLLSDCLAELPPTPEGRPAEVFVSQVMLRLPREQTHDSSQSIIRKLWKAVPFALFSLWAVFQAAVFVSTLATGALQLGLDNGVFSTLLGGVPNASNLTSPPIESGTLLDSFQWILVGSRGFGWTFILYFLALMITSVLYWSWLASWWVGHKHSLPAKT